MLVLEQQKNQERRKFQRVSFSEPIEFQFDEFTPFQGSLSKDLSEGGLRVQLNDFIALDTEMNVHITFKTGQLIETIARVAWVEKMPHMDRYQIGLEFLREDAIYHTRTQIQAALDDC